MQLYLNYISATITKKVSGKIHFSELLRQVFSPTYSYHRFALQNNTSLREASAKTDIFSFHWKSWPPDRLFETGVLAGLRVSRILIHAAQEDYANFPCLSGVSLVNTGVRYHRKDTFGNVACVCGGESLTAFSFSYVRTLLSSIILSTCSGNHFVCGACVISFPIFET